ncbi:hypothetical protein Pmani_029487, partial [Petrolisthes manimaculis]
MRLIRSTSPYPVNVVGRREGDAEERRGEVLRKMLRRGE